MREIHNIDITNRIAKAVELARKVADASACGFRHGAVLINNGGAYINAASNKRNYSSFCNRFDFRVTNGNLKASRHAESRACLNIPAALTVGGTIVVVRIGKNGELRNSRPCEMCQAVMDFCGIKKIYYSNDDGSLSMIRA